MREWTYSQRLFLDLAAKHKRVVLKAKLDAERQEQELDALEQKLHGGPQY